MSKVFTPEEIAESLEVCQNTGIGCTGCVLDEHPDYSDVEIICRCDLEKMAAAAIKELLEENKRLREEARWIPVTERLPGPDDGPYSTYADVSAVSVLAVIEGAEWATTLYFDGYDFFDLQGDEVIPYRVTHWKPMPKGPEAE